MLTVVIKTDPNGCQTVYVDGPARVLSVCDHIPEDRVYELSGRSLRIVSAEEIAEIIGDSRIGQFGDMPGKENAVAEALGVEKPHPEKPKPKLVEG